MKIIYLFWCNDPSIKSWRVADGSALAFCFQLSVTGDGGCEILFKNRNKNESKWAMYNKTQRQFLNKNTQRFWISTEKFFVKIWHGFRQLQIRIWFVKL